MFFNFKLSILIMYKLFYLYRSGDVKGDRMIELQDQLELQRLANAIFIF